MNIAVIYYCLESEFVYFYIEEIMYICLCMVKGDIVFV